MQKTGTILPSLFDESGAPAIPAFQPCVTRPIALLRPRAIQLSSQKESKSMQKTGFPFFASCSKAIANHRPCAPGQPGKISGISR
jgi:hypothetical protein